MTGFPARSEVTPAAGGAPQVSEDVPARPAWLLPAAPVVFAAIIATPFGPWLASTMVGHVLVQIPMLVAVGFALGQCVKPRIGRALANFNAGGIPGILLVTFTLAFWMIPRWLDGSITSAWIADAKYYTLVLLAGMPLALSWSRLHPVARGVVKIEFLAMLLRLGWLYQISPVRFCNNYLLTDQVWLGRGMILVAIALSITWVIPVFFGEFAVETERTSAPS